MNKSNFFAKKILKKNYFPILIHEGLANLKHLESIFDNTKIINRFRGGNSFINQYIAFGIRPEKKLKTINFSYV